MGLEIFKGRNTLVVLSAREVLPNVIVGLYLAKFEVLINRIVILTTEWETAKKMAENQKIIFENNGLETSILEIPTYNHKGIVEVLSKAIDNGIINPEKNIFLTNASTKYTVEVVHHYLTDKGSLSIYYLPDRKVKLFGGDT